jgi:hypothetical protein
MRNYIRGALTLGAMSAGSACSSPPLTARAAEVKKLQCDPSTMSQEALVRSVNVLRVEPIYSHVLTGNNNSEDRVCGAKILVRPPPSVDLAQVTRVLQCHSALVLLGQAVPPTVPNDPYLLHDAWVTIDVKPEDGNFAVVVSTDSVRGNIELLGRARKYGNEHMVAVDALP